MIATQLTNTPIRLWPHQVAAISATHSAIDRGDSAGLWSLPCGTGKTWAFVRLARDLDWPTLILVHRDELVRQTIDTLEAVWPDVSVGVVKAQRDEWQDGQQVVLASVQSLHNGRLDRMPRDRFDLVIADEAHHSAARTWRAIIAHFQHKFLLGASATPERLDGEGLSDLFGPLPLYSYPLRKAIRDGILVPLRQYGVTTETDLDGVSVRGGDFSTRELSNATNTSARNKIVVNAYLQHASDRRAVVFSVDVEHAKALASAFQGEGVSTAIVAGNTPLDERREVLAAFRRGDIHAICNCELLIEGWNDRGVSAVLMARPTKSRSLYTQAIGRALRRCDEEGKQDAIVIDFCDNARRHKLVTVFDLFGTTDKNDAAGADVIAVVDCERKAAEQRQEIAIQAPLTWRSTEVCPWGGEQPTLAGYVAAARWHSHEASNKQLRYLASFGVEVSRALSKGECSHLIDRLRECDVAHPMPATDRQQKFLVNQNRWRDGITKREANGIIGKLMKRIRQQPQRRNNGRSTKRVGAFRS